MFVEKEEKKPVGQGYFCNARCAPIGDSTNHLAVNQRE
jgi:hypothetical protein